MDYSYDHVEEEAALTVEEHLKRVCYTPDPAYVPSDFALDMVNFIKLVTDGTGEENLTPILHLYMLDTIAENQEDIINMVFRGAAKTTLLAEFLILYIAVYGEIPHLKDISLILYITDTIDNGVKNMSKNLENRFENSNFLQKYLKADIIQNRWEFKALDGRKLIVKGYGAQTGIRGVRELNVRPQLAIIDDIIGDADAESLPSMSKIRDTVDKAIEHALHPTRRRVIWSGTPFHTTDPLYAAVESGAYAVNVFPVCEKFPCTREEFVGAWPDRFTYDAVMRSYTAARKKGALPAFYQELMLRIRSEEDRLVPDEHIRYFKRSLITQNLSAFNFYMTTDFSTSEKASADFAVVMVWALSNDGRWLLVDGVCKRQRMPDTINDIFRMVSKWKPQSVGLEISGQQGAFVDWIEEQMLERNIYFHLASTTKGVAGIRPSGDKFSRFGLTLPLFNLGKIRFAEELRGTPLMDETLLELEYLTVGGAKSAHDDCLDGIAMIMQLDAWRPSEEIGDEEVEAVTHHGNDIYADMWGGGEPERSTSLSRYTV